MTKRNNGMMNITISLPDDFVEIMDGLHAIGIYPSRSEILRISVYEKIKKERANKKITKNLLDILKGVRV
jgi:Arc/MetJ-type ribon-helix-helix transcriptional regulator